MTENQTIKDRLISFIQYLKIGQRKFEHACGLANGYVNNIRRSVSPEKLQIIAQQFPELNTGWLMTGEGEMLKTAPEAEEPQKPVKNYTEGAPFYDVTFDLGFHEFEAPEHERPEYLINAPGYEHATLWCRAAGESMRPEINSGDLIALRRVDDFSWLSYGDIYGIITRNGLRTIKRIGHSDQPGCIRLIPSNPAFEAQDIPLDMITIVYRVLGTMKAF